MYLPTSSGRVCTALYQRVVQPENIPAVALPVTAKVCVHRMRSISYREVYEISSLQKHHGTSSNKIGSAKLHYQCSYQCFLLARLKSGDNLFYFGLFGFSFSSTHSEKSLKETKNTTGKKSSILK